MLDSTAEPTSRPYSSTATGSEQLLYLSSVHPEFFSYLDSRKIAMLMDYIVEMDSISWEFEDETKGGRGPAYNYAQKSADNRRIGMTNLLRCFSPSYDAIPDRSFKLLDVLGGDGTIARFCASQPGPMPTVYTADISEMMVRACFVQGLPCIRQAATNSLFRDDILDGVLIAYGSHHIGSEERHLAVSEAFRTLVQGGRLVLHDFEVGGAASKWFDEVVDPFSRTGHSHPHFTRNEMLNLFLHGGFRDVRIFDMEDPFTLFGESPEEARHNALRHMYLMYGLEKLPEPSIDRPGPLQGLVEEIFGTISVTKQGDRYVSRISRQALVAVGTKSKR